MNEKNFLEILNYKIFCTFSGFYQNFIFKRF